MRLSIFVLSVLAQGCIASPLAERATSTSSVTAPISSATPTTYSWSEDWNTSFPIHKSCNSTLRAQLDSALNEAVQLAEHAKNHLLRFGGKSELVQKYFGNGSLAEPIGWFERVVSADKGNMTFRCDDPDKNCVARPSKCSVQ